MPVDQDTIPVDIEPNPTPTSAPTWVAHYSCIGCGETIHINAPKGAYNLDCSHCDRSNAVFVGDADEVQTPISVRAS